MPSGEGPRTKKVKRGLEALSDHPLAGMIQPDPVEDAVEKVVEEEPIPGVVAAEAEPELERNPVPPASATESVESVEVKNNIEEASRKMDAFKERVDVLRKNNLLAPHVLPRIDFARLAAEFARADYENDPTDAMWQKFESEASYYEGIISEMEPEDQRAKEQMPAPEIEISEPEYIANARKELESLGSEPFVGKRTPADVIRLNLILALENYKTDVYYDKAWVENKLKDLRRAIDGAEGNTSGLENKPEQLQDSAELLDVEKSRSMLTSFDGLLTVLGGQINQFMYNRISWQISDAKDALKAYEQSLESGDSARAAHFSGLVTELIQFIDADFSTIEQNLAAEKQPDLSDVPQEIENLEPIVFTPETRREHKMKLGELVAQVQSATVGAAKNLITEKETKKQKDEREKREGREERLERIAQKFAAEVGATKERDALLAARKELFDAEKQYAKDGFAPDNIGELRKVHNDLAIAYTQKLDEKASEIDNEQASQVASAWRDAEPQRSMRGRAALVRIHDTVRTPMDMRARIREEIRQERNGTLNLRTPLVIASKAFNGYNALHDLGAEKYVNLFHKNESPEKKHELAQRIAKASKLVTAAGVTSFVFGGASFGVRLVRSFVGATVGGTLAAGAGKVYDALRGKAVKEEYEKERKDVASRAGSEEEKIEKLERQQQAYKKGNKKAIQKERQLVQFATAIAGGGATSMGFSMAGIGVEHALSSSHSAPITNLSSVKGAAQTLHGEQSSSLARGFAGDYPEPANTGNLHVPASQIHEAGAYPAQEHAPTAPEPARVATAPTAPTAPAAPAAPAAPTESYQEVKIVQGQGADRMFSNLHKVIDDSQTHSHLVDKLINEKPHLLSQRFGFPDHNANGYMQPGDSVKIENHELVFHRGEHSVVLMHENPDGSVTDNPDARAEIQKLTSHHHHTPTHHEAAPAQEKADTGAPKAADTHVTPTPPQPPAPPGPPEPPAVHHESVVRPVDAPPPAPVAPEFKDAPPSVTAITHTDAWQTYHDFDASKVLSNPPEGGDASAADFRTQLFSIMRESGVGPNVNETITHYTSRAVDAIHEHAAKGLSHYDTYPAIYEAPDHHLQIHGGDLNARIAVAKEYLSTHPDAQIVMENPGQKTPFFLYSKATMASEYFPPVDISKLAKISSTAQPVF